MMDLEHEVGQFLMKAESDGRSLSCCLVRVSSWLNVPLMLLVLESLFVFELLVLKSLRFVPTCLVHVSMWYVSMWYHLSFPCVYVVCVYAVEYGAYASISS